MNKIILIIICSLFILTSVNAQVMLRIEGDVFDFSEAGAIITEQDDKVTVVMAMDRMRPKEYKNLNIKKGDVVFMANGEKIKSVKQLEKIYEANVEGKISLLIQQSDFTIVYRSNEAYRTDLTQSIGLIIKPNKVYNIRF